MVASSASSPADPAGLSEMTANCCVPPGRAASGCSSTVVRFSTTLGLFRDLSRNGSFISSFAVRRFSMGEMHFRMNERKSLSMILSNASGFTPPVTLL